MSRGSVTTTPNFLEDSGPADKEALESYGIPEIHWAAPASFAAANGMSTTTGKFLLRDALILRHRLPAIYARVVSGQVQAWRARRIAQAVLGAPADVVAYIDATLADIAHKVGPVALTRLLDEAMLQLHAEEVEIAQAEELSRRHVTSTTARAASTTASPTSMRAVTGRTSTTSTAPSPRSPDRLQHTPEGEHESFDTRRSMALGVLADPAQPSPSSTARSRRHRPSRSCSTSTSPTRVSGRDPVGRNETTGRAVLDQQIRDWCGRTDAHLTVKPVIDLNDHETSRPTRSRTGSASARSSATRPASSPGAPDPPAAATATTGSPAGRTHRDNLAPLCRHHHRLKTHAGWRYTRSHQTTSSGPTRTSNVSSAAATEPPSSRRLDIAFTS